MDDPIAKALNMRPIDFDYSIYHVGKYDPEISRKEARERNAEIVACDKCGVSGNRPNMMRWHFENCKTVLKNCKQCGEIIPRQNIKDYLYEQKTYCNRKCYMESKKGKAPFAMTDEIKKKISDARRSNSRIRK